MRFNITETSPYALLRLAIKDVCSDYEPAANPEEADAVITLGELQGSILEQLDGALNEKDKKFVTPEFLRAELKSNHLTETLLMTDDGIREVWFLKKTGNE